MKTEWASFGDAGLLEISVRWCGDSEPRSRRPAAYGWSIGDIKITVAGQIITRGQRGAAFQNSISWYLLPMLEWLADQWAPLLHEEEFAWPERSSSPAAIATSRALEKWIAASAPQERAWYRQARAWYNRHCLRAASSGGVFPDLFLRRFLNTIEVSWTHSAPLFARQDFTFVAPSGVAFLPVSAVATPLWGLLEWAAQTAHSSYDEDQPAIEAFKAKFQGLKTLSTARLQDAYAGHEVLERVRAALVHEHLEEMLNDNMVGDLPAIEEFSPAVAMFGGVSPDLNARDVASLVGQLGMARRGGDSAALSNLIEDAGQPSARPPHLDGQRRALRLIEAAASAQHPWIDIESLVAELGVATVEITLDTDTVRGVALAGAGLRPTIIVNLASPYNLTPEGRRFSIAHELCHILYDRSHARRVAVSSGPWAPPGIERRANAFAAMLLMPPSLVQVAVPDWPVTPDGLIQAASKLRVSQSALTEHLYNLGKIDEHDRERLRQIHH